MKKVYPLISLVLFLFLSSLAGCTQDKRNYGEIKPLRSKQVKMKDMFGINGFEWDFYDAHNNFDSAKFNIIRNFSGFRHFLDWERVEPQKEVFRFNHKPEGGWSYDEIYEKCMRDSITVLVDLQVTPNWLINTYPEGQRQRDLSPLPYGAKKDLPKSYIDIAKAGFQLAARYGRNKNIDKKLILVPKESASPVIGLGYVKYLESSNEPDKWWRGKDAEQSPEEYAAQLSAFYDGHKGSLGAGVGVKTADPTMMVVMGGIAKPNVEYVKRMVEWCKKNRGMKKDGKVDLCFDVINYHMYSNDYTGWFAKFRTKNRGVAPETNDMTEIANSFVNYAAELGNMPVWSTETGYDLGNKSSQRAIAIGSKSKEITQADWLLRLGLLYARQGLDRVFYYQLYDNNEPGADDGGTFGFSGLVDRSKRRPAADYIRQVTKLMGDYYYLNTINKDPIVDVYQLGKKRMFVLAVPDEVDRKEKYSLDLQQAKKALIYTLQPGKDAMSVKEVAIPNGILELEVSETPIFVEAKL
ncbi:hypothetical protein [Pedobacter gandavensis]|uniref:Glycoside hydrolase family 42 N-terminal domain-containing protein n=1 Tax=Pedobacter gandavensis TaxID=2679963 RepID=A0ABR6ET72_9SPHI|nr:hypothetical protein [Pedobacter gandavensis]MBB2148402.1 hypothetical protein [Pedobacter gandavensis]